MIYSDIGELVARAAQVGWQFRGKVEQLPLDVGASTLLPKYEAALARLAEEAQRPDGMPLIDVEAEIWKAW